MQSSGVIPVDRSLASLPPHAARVVEHGQASTPQSDAASRLQFPPAQREPDIVTLSAVARSLSHAPAAVLASTTNATTPARDAAIRLAGKHGPSAQLATTHTATTPTHAAEGRLAQRPNRPSFAAATHAGNHAPAANLRSSASPATPEDAAAARLAQRLGDAFQRGMLARELAGQGPREDMHAATATSPSERAALPPATRHAQPHHEGDSRKPCDGFQPGDAAVGMFWAFLASANRDAPVIDASLRDEPGISAGTSAFGREASEASPTCESHDEASQISTPQPHTRGASPMPSTPPPPQARDIVVTRLLGVSPRWGIIDVIA